MIIYGSLARRQPVHADLAMCPRCGVESLHEIERRYRVAVLWLPLFVYDARVVGRCGHCLVEYPVGRVDYRLPKASVVHRFGWTVLVLLFLIPFGLGGWGMAASSPAAETAAAPLPVGEQVLARLEEELVDGQARGLDPKCRGFAKQAREALKAAGDFDSEALAVACARVYPRAGRPRVVLVARVPSLTVDRERLAEAAHSVNRALEISDDHDILWAAGDAAGYRAIAKGSRRGAWRLQTDSARVRPLLIDALTY